MTIIRKEGTHKDTDIDTKDMSLHDKLCLKAEEWLRSVNCKVTFNKQFKVYSENGELPDAIGWREGISILVEVITCRPYFLADKSKAYRVYPETGMGDWRFYLCPEGVINCEDLPKGWGLLHMNTKGKHIYKIHGVPPNIAQWHTKKPFTGCKISENMMLVSALRRLDKC